MTPYPGKNYGKRQFINDLKSVIKHFLSCISRNDLQFLLQAMHAAGVEGDLVFYVLEEHHFSDQNFYAMPDCLLASGEVI